MERLHGIIAELKIRWVGLHVLRVLLHFDRLEPLVMKHHKLATKVCSHIAPLYPAVLVGTWCKLLHYCSH